MPAFKSARVTHQFTQTNPASPDRVFPLLCPVREADWIPGWRHRLIYSDSGVAELGCVFTTPNFLKRQAHNPAAPEITWITTDYDPAEFRIAYVWFSPGDVIAELRIQLSPAGKEATHSHITFRYTGLSEEGNREVESYDRAWFESRMKGWETNINHYLETGALIAV